MTAVGLILMGLFVALSWVYLNPKVRIDYWQGVYGMSEADARQRVLKPAYHAVLWAGRIAVSWLYLGLVAILAFGLDKDLMIPLYWSMIAVGAASWTFFYFWLTRKG